MKNSASLTAEEPRLQEDPERTRNWKRWGPCLSERQWTTVRAVYSPHGNCWDYLSSDALKIECPAGSGHMMNRSAVAQELSRRHARPFLPNEAGAQPCRGADGRYATDPHRNELAEVLA